MVTGESEANRGVDLGVEVVADKCWKGCRGRNAILRCEFGLPNTRRQENMFSTKQP